MRPHRNTVLLVVGYAFPGSEPLDWGIVILHRILGIGVIWILWAFVTRQERSSKRLEFLLYERGLAQEREQQAAERFRNLADSMPQLVWTARPDGTVDYYNERYREFGGILPGPNQAWTWSPVIHEEDLHRTVDAWKHSLATGETYQVEHRVRHADGTFHWYLSRGIPVHSEPGVITKWYGTATNIDEVKSAQADLLESEAALKNLADSLEQTVTERTAQVRALSKALTIAEQRERSRFSQILHDNIQQILLVVKMRLDIISMEETAANVEEFNELRRLVEKAIDASRSVALELNPPILGSEGLDAALSWLVHHMGERYGLNITTDISPQLSSVPETQRILVIQITRELLLNVVVHAHTCDVSITAQRVNGWLRMLFEDNGIGFDVSKARQHSAQMESLGLFSIEERLKLFGGKLTIDSHPGGGTKIEMILPVK